MKNWSNITQAIQILNKEIPDFNFTFKKIEWRIKNKSLKAVNISFEGSPIWRIKKDWIEQFKKDFKYEEIKRIAQKSFVPSREEKSEAIFFLLLEKLGRKISKGELESLVEKLPKNEKLVMIHRYGLNDGIFKSLSHVGKKIGLSKQRAGQIEKSAIKKLRELIKE